MDPKQMGNSITNAFSMGWHRLSDRHTRFFSDSQHPGGVQLIVDVLDGLRKEQYRTANRRA